MDLLLLSQKIRQTRQAQGMTVEELAKKSGFSKAFISRLENFRVCASLNALNKICESLGITMSDLFSQDGKAPEYVFGNIREGERVDRDNSSEFGMNYFSLAFKKPDRRLEPFFIEYKASETQRDFLMHENDEFFMLLDGVVEFQMFNAGNSKPMKSGDTVYLSKNIPHRVVLSPGCEYASALVVYEKLD